MGKAELENALDVAIISDEESKVLQELIDEYEAVVKRLKAAEDRLLKPTI